MGTMMEALLAARALPLHAAQRFPTGIAAIDSIFKSDAGAGLEVGVYVLGGDAGAGKTTFCLQVMEAMAKARHFAVYLAYEGYANAVGACKRLRLEELISVFAADDVTWKPDTDMLVAAMAQFAAENDTGLPLVLCIDSVKNLDSGSIAARKNAIKTLHKAAHKYGVILIIIAHATKDSEGKLTKKLEGPAELAGDSDAVLYLINTTPNAEFPNITLHVRKSRFCATGKHPGFILRKTGYDWPVPGVVRKARPLDDHLNDAWEATFGV